MNITIDLVITTGIAALVVLLGNFIVVRVKLFRDFCIPAPVVSGLLVSIILCILKVNHILSVKWTATLGGWSMNLFLTAVGFGFTADLIKKGGKLCAKISIITVILITLQDIVGVFLAKIAGVHPLIGLSCGSLAMYGGVGTAAAFGPIFEKLGCDGATAIGVAAGTFGMVVASLCGGPVARFLIRRDGLKPGLEDAAPADNNDKKNGTSLKCKKNVQCIFLAFDDRRNWRTYLYAFEAYPGY